MIRPGDTEVIEQKSITVSPITHFGKRHIVFRRTVKLTNCVKDTLTSIKSGQLKSRRQYTRRSQIDMKLRLWVCPECGIVRAFEDYGRNLYFCDLHTERWPDGESTRSVVMKRTNIEVNADD